jgi:dolichol-phosphate mannosyltransferase
MVSLIVPTYNEAENIEELIERASSALSDCEHEIIVVDDNSPDGTIDIAQSLSAKFNMKTIVRHKDKGLAKSVIAGFNIAEGSVLGVIDADLSHPPELIPELLYVLDRADIAIASRLVEGGGAEGWPRHRKLSSFIGSFLAKPLTDVKDPMSGFFFMKKKVIEGVALKGQGYKILLEILVKGNYNSAEEVPFIFRDRTAGRSKLGFWVSLEYLFQLIDLYHYKFIQKAS